jgi:hypothetical protein
MPGKQLIGPRTRNRVPLLKSNPEMYVFGSNLGCFDSVLFGLAEFV